MNALSKGSIARIAAIVAGALVYLVMIYRYGIAWYWAFLLGALVLIVLQIFLVRLVANSDRR